MPLLLLCYCSLNALDLARISQSDGRAQDEYSILNSRHSIGIHGYMLVYSVASKQSFEMVKIIRDKVLNHLVCQPTLHTAWYSTDCSMSKGRRLGSNRGSRQ
jgi:hypothetical protein